MSRCKVLPNTLKEIKRTLSKTCFSNLNSPNNSIFLHSKTFSKCINSLKCNNLSLLNKCKLKQNSLCSLNLCNLSTRPSLKCTTEPYTGMITNITRSLHSYLYSFLGTKGVILTTSMTWTICLETERKKSTSFDSVFIVNFEL